MKALFYIFLAVNLLVLALGLYHEETPPAQAVIAPEMDKEPELLLLSEREVQPARPASESDTSVAQVATASVPRSETAPEPEAKLASVTETTPAPPPEAIIEVEETKPAPVATVSLPETPPEPASHCRSLGPIRSDERATNIAEQLNALGIDTAQRTEPRTVTRHLVVIPAAEDQAKAKQMVKKLAAAGIKDVWMFYRGDMINAISLGLFSQRGSAESRQRQVIAKGFAPEIVARENEITRLWLDLTPSAKIEIDAATWKTIEDKNPDISLKPRPCEPIVSASDSP